MSLLWVTASQSQWYHLSEDPDWQPNPDHRPRNYWDSRDVSEHDQGLFITTHPDRWQAWGRSQRHVHPVSVSEEALANAKHNSGDHEAFVPKEFVHHVQRMT